MRRCKPLPSVSMNGLRRGFAFSIASAVSDIEYTPSVFKELYAQSYTHVYSLSQVTMGNGEAPISSKRLKLFYYEERRTTMERLGGARGGNRTPTPCGTRF